MPNRADREVIVLDERLHNPRLIECRDRAWWRVGAQDEALVLHTAHRPFDDRWDEAMSGLTRPLEMLEAIEDLVVPVVGRYDTNGQVGQLGLVRSDLPGT